MTKAEIRTIATIRKKGLFSNQVIIHKENSRAEDKVYNCGRVKAEPYKGQYILNFTPKSTSVGVTSKGTVSSRRYAKPKSMVVDEVRWE